jgi:hypothetical protein
VLHPGQLAVDWGAFVIQRYSEPYLGYFGANILPDEEGQWVRYEDHIAAMKGERKMIKPDSQTAADRLGFEPFEYCERS